MREALEITDGDFDHDVERLIWAVEIACGDPRPAPAVPVQPRKQNSCLLLALGGLVAVGVVVFFVVVLGLLAASNQNTNRGEGPTQQQTQQPTQAPVVVNQFPIGRWTLYVQTDDGEVDVDVDIFANGTYQSNRGHAGTYVYEGSELELENWGVIHFRQQDGNAYVGSGTLDDTAMPDIRLAPR
jgi:hypothetical protein